MGFFFIPVPAMTNSQTALEIRRPFGLVGFAIWATALYGSLQVYRLENLFGHSICGPWGCGPPLAALVGYHLFWMLLLVPFAWVAAQELSPEIAAMCSKWILLASVVAVTALLVQDAVWWMSNGGNRAAHYLPQRMMFRLITYVDFPIMQLGLVGYLLRHLAKAKKSQPTVAADTL